MCYEFKKLCEQSDKQIEAKHLPLADAFFLLGRWHVS